MHHLLLPLVFVVIATACANKGPATGAERGACRANATCDEGLTCASGLCVRLPIATIEEQRKAAENLKSAARKEIDEKLRQIASLDEELARATEALEQANNEDARVRVVAHLEELRGRKAALSDEVRALQRDAPP